MTVTTDKPAHMQHMPHFVAPLAPFTAESAKGSWVTDTDGNRWLDFVMGIAVMNTGYSHPKVVKAVQDQAAKVSHAQMGVWRHQPMLDLAAKMQEILPAGMDQGREQDHTVPGHLIEVTGGSGAYGGFAETVLQMVDHDLPQTPLEEGDPAVGRDQGVEILQKPPVLRLAQPPQGGQGQVH